MGSSNSHNQLLNYIGTGQDWCSHDLLTMKRQWTYGQTLLPWFDYFHTSLACFTAP